MSSLEVASLPGASAVDSGSIRKTTEFAKAVPFLPPEPATLQETGLSAGDVEALILKHLLVAGAATGRKVADQLKLPFGIVQGLLRGLKQQMLVNYTGQASMGDFDHELTEEGEKRGRWHADRCTYCGAAPVPLKQYIASVAEQSVKKIRPKLADLCNAFADLSMSAVTLGQIGQAIFAGKGLFLYGQPGNGKTSLAERVIRAADQYIWIPRTITVTSEIIRLFDPANHEQIPENGASNLLKAAPHDRRWVRIKRPSIVVGGELRMEQLEITNNAATGIIESPLQMKANCGALVIDDFGRQRMTTAELLNRWIVPLEKGFDFLSLPSGRQIQVPFDPLLVFSTNLEPHKLVDEAFLRRIPYKIEVTDPSPREFCELFKQWCEKLEIEYREDAFEYLLTTHYGAAGRPFRYCHPRDLTLQVKTYCEFHELPTVLTTKALDVAVSNYFSTL